MIERRGRKGVWLTAAQPRCVFLSGWDKSSGTRLVTSASLVGRKQPVAGHAAFGFLRISNWSPMTSFGSELLKSHVEGRLVIGADCLGAGFDALLGGIFLIL